jgi:dTDP-4-dehydrorhamnose 3,5-epimerase
MRFHSTDIPNVTIVEIEPREDHRGFFARVFDATEFEQQGLTGRVVQANLSYNRRAGTVRGLHYQHPPAAEAKLIRCIAGEAFFAVVDLREGPTRLQHVTTTLRHGDGRSLFVPEGCAVGMQTQEDETELLYHVSAYYTPDAEGGLRYDDPALGIRWPRPMEVISDKDAAWPSVSP